MDWLKKRRAKRCARGEHRLDMADVYIGQPGAEFRADCEWCGERFVYRMGRGKRERGVLLPYSESRMAVTERLRSIGREPW